VAISEATKEDKLVAPTAETLKLYGGAEKICERVIEMRTSQEMQIVKSRVAHATIGERIMKKGLRMVLQNETLSQYPFHGMSSFMYESLGSDSPPASACGRSSIWIADSFSFMPISIVLPEVSMLMASGRW
jgi:hypothetical protein